jgi:hypothetical protein
MAGGNAEDERQASNLAVIPEGCGAIAEQSPPGTYWPEHHRARPGSSSWRTSPVSHASPTTSNRPRCSGMDTRVSAAAFGLLRPGMTNAGGARGKSLSPAIGCKPPPLRHPRRLAGPPPTSSSSAIGGSHPSPSSSSSKRREAERDPRIHAGTAMIRAAVQEQASARRGVDKAAAIPNRAEDSLP